MNREKLEKQIGSLTPEQERRYYDQESLKYAGLYEKVFRAIEEKMAQHPESGYRDSWRVGFAWFIRDDQSDDKDRVRRRVGGRCFRTGLYFLTCSLSAEIVRGGRYIIIEGRPVHDFYEDVRSFVSVSKTWEEDTGGYVYRFVERGLRIKTDNLRFLARTQLENIAQGERLYEYAPSGPIFVPNPPVWYQEFSLLTGLDTEQRLQALLEEIPLWQPTSEPRWTTIEK